MNPGRFRFWLGAILLAAAVAYWPSLAAPYYLDDFSLFSDPAILPGGAERIFDFARTRTLTYLSFLATFRGGGQEPVLDHAVDLALFLLLVVLAASLYRELIGPRAALLAVSLAALHPLATESVIYVFARATLLAAVFSFAAWAVWIRNRRWTAVLLAALAMGAKEEAVVLPIFFACFEVLYRRKPIQALSNFVRPLAAMTACSAFFAARVLYAAYVTPASGALVGLQNVTPLTYFQAQGRALWLYIRLFAFPYGFNFDHAIAVRDSLDGWALLGWSAIAALALFCLFRVRRQPVFFFPVAAMIFLAPTSTIAPLGDIAAERRMLLPLFCLAPFLGSLAVRWLPGRRFAVAVAAATAALGCLTYLRAATWSDAETLWRDTVAKSPGKARPKLHLASALGERGAVTYPQRETLLREAVAVEPRSAGAWGELGVLLLRLGRGEEAADALRTAYDLAPDDPSLATNLGVALASLGRVDEAESLFRAALDLNPCHFDARNNLLFVLRNRGDVEQARATAALPSGCLLPAEEQAALARAADL